MDEDHFLHFLDFHSRRERYELAGKTLRYRVYRALENYVAISLVLSFAIPWLADGFFKSALLWNTVPVAIAGLLHHGKLLGRMPWLVLAAAFEAWLVWAIYNWGISRYFAYPHFWVLCVFVFVMRYWQRGEREVNVAAFRKAIERAS